jgi:tungstate transport system ATP-binding protein
METLLEIRNLVVKADKNAILDIPELQVKKGEVLVLLGANGAGKSTLLSIAAGLKKPTSGTIHFSQNSHLSDLEYRRKVSTVFQTPLLLTDNVENNVASGLRFRGMKQKEIKARVEHWLDLFHILHLAKRQAKDLSGGEAQRVSLARAFCLETELILMDEPFSALDAPTRQELIVDLRQIFARTNQTCIYVTHDLEEALTIGDRIAVLFKGRMHQLGRTQDVFNHPATLEVASFMGVENIIPGIVSEQIEKDLLQIQADHATIEVVGNLPIGAPVFICLRPEDITLYPVDPAIQPSSARNHLSCRIVSLINQGPLVKVHLNAGFNLTALITRPSAHELGIKVGKIVTATFKATAIHLVVVNKTKQQTD